MFKAYDNGFSITFENGYTVFVQWGKDYSSVDGKLNPYECGLSKCYSAEVIIENAFNEVVPPSRFLDREYVIYNDDLSLGYMTPEEVAEILDIISKVP